MNELAIFNNNDFSSVRAVEINGEAWFVAADVTNALGYSNGRKAVADHVDEEDKGVTICDTLGGKQKLTIINQSGVIALTLSSKLPNAKKFKRWITSEVVPAIMKHGMYATPQTIEDILADPDSAIKTLQKLKEERAARIAEQQKNALLESKIAEDKPKVVFATALLVSKDSILVREMAKILVQNGVPNIGGNRLWDWLRDHGYIAKHSCEPLQWAMERGYFEVKTTIIDNGTSTPKMARTTKVTTKGQEHFINVFLAGKYDGQTTINFNE